MVKVDRVIAKRTGVEFPIHVIYPCDAVRVFEKDVDITRISFSFHYQLRKYGHVSCEMLLCPLDVDVSVAGLDLQGSTIASLAAPDFARLLEKFRFESDLSDLFRVESGLVFSARGF